MTIETLALTGSSYGQFERCQVERADATQTVNSHFLRDRALRAVLLNPGAAQRESMSGSLDSLISATSWQTGTEAAHSEIYTSFAVPKPTITYDPILCELRAAYELLNAAVDLEHCQATQIREFFRNQLRDKALARLLSHLKEAVTLAQEEGEDPPTPGAMSTASELAKWVADAAILSSDVSLAAFGLPEGGASLIVDNRANQRRLRYKISADGRTVVWSKLEPDGRLEKRKLGQNRREEIRRHLDWLTR